MIDYSTRDGYVVHFQIILIRMYDESFSSLMISNDQSAMNDICITFEKRWLHRPQSDTELSNGNTITLSVTM